MKSNILQRANLPTFFFYHNKIHPITNYKAIKNKSNKTDNTGHKIYIRHIPLSVNYVHRLNMKYIEEY